MAEPQPGDAGETAEFPAAAAGKAASAAAEGAPAHGLDDWHPVPRASGQPVCAVVTEARGVERVRAFARRWRALRYHRDEKRRPWLSTHDLCGPACTGLSSRCLKSMVREGFLAPVLQVQR